MKIDIFTGATSVRSKNIFTDISRYPTGKHEIKCGIVLLVQAVVPGRKIDFIIGQNVTEDNYSWQVLLLILKLILLPVTTTWTDCSVTDLSSPQ